MFTYDAPLELCVRTMSASCSFPTFLLAATPNRSNVVKPVHKLKVCVENNALVNTFTFQLSYNMGKENNRPSTKTLPERTKETV